VNKQGRRGVRLGREKDYKKEHNKDYKFNNKDKIIEQQKEYYEANKIKIFEQKSAKVTCDCGSVVRHGDIAQHKKTIRHTNYMLTLE
jgi:hypothetical protein